MPPLTLMIHTLNILIGILSLAIFALLAHNISLTSSLSTPIPADVNGTPRAMLFWPACGGIVDCLLFIIVSFFSHNNSKNANHSTKKTKAFANGILFIASFILFRPLVVLIYTFVEARSSRLMTETWACGIGEEGVCKELRAARWVLVPEVVLAVGMLGCVVWRRVPRGKEGGVRARVVEGEGRGVGVGVGKCRLEEE